MGDFTGQDITNTAWVFAAVGRPHTQLFTALAGRPSNSSVRGERLQLSVGSVGSAIRLPEALEKKVGIRWSSEKLSVWRELEKNFSTSGRIRKKNRRPVGLGKNMGIRRDLEKNPADRFLYFRINF